MCIRDSPHAAGSHLAVNCGLFCSLPPEAHKGISSWSSSQARIHKLDQDHALEWPQHPRSLFSPEFPWSVADAPHKAASQQALCDLHLVSKAFHRPSRQQGSPGAHFQNRRDPAPGRPRGVNPVSSLPCYFPRESSRSRKGVPQPSSPFRSLQHRSHRPCLRGHAGGDLLRGCRGRSAAPC